MESIAELMKSKGYLTTLQAAQKAGITRRAMQRLVQQGKVKSWEVMGGTHLVEWASVQDYFARAPSDHIRGRKPKPSE